MTNRNDTLLLATICEQILDKSVPNQAIFDILNNSLTIDEFRHIIVRGIKCFRQNAENLEMVQNIYSKMINHDDFTVSNNTSKENKYDNSDEDMHNDIASQTQQVFSIEDLTVNIFQYLDYQSLCHCREVSLQWFNDANNPLSLYRMTWKLMMQAICVRCNIDEISMVNTIKHMIKIHSLNLHYLQSIIIETDDDKPNLQLLKLIIMLSRSDRDHHSLRLPIRTNDHHDRLKCNINNITIWVRLESARDDTMSAWLRELSHIYFPNVKFFEFILYNAHDSVKENNIYCYKFKGEKWSGPSKKTCSINQSLAKHAQGEYWISYLHHATSLTELKSKMAQWDYFLQTSLNANKCMYVGDIIFPIVISGNPKPQKWLNVSLDLTKSVKLVDCIKYLYKWYCMESISCSLFMSVNTGFCLLRDNTYSDAQNDAKILQTLIETKNGNWIALIFKAMAHVFQLQYTKNIHDFQAGGTTTCISEYHFPDIYTALKVNIDEPSSGGRFMDDFWATARMFSDCKHARNEGKRHGYIIYDAIFFNDRIKVQFSQKFDTDTSNANVVSNEIYTLLKIVLTSRCHPGK